MLLNWLILLGLLVRQDEALNTLDEAFDYTLVLEMSRKATAKRLTAATLIVTLGGLRRVILHLRGWHRVPRLVPIVLLLTVPAGVDLSVHRLPGVGAILSAKLVALVNWPLATLLKRDERPRSRN